MSSLWYKIFCKFLQRASVKSANEADLYEVDYLIEDTTSLSWSRVVKNIDREAGVSWICNNNF
jgi:hypothetical protein